MRRHSTRGAHEDRSQLTLPLALTAAVLGLGALALWDRRRRDAAISRMPSDSAPGWTSRRSTFNAMSVVGSSVTINKPRSELYAFWRDFANLPGFMENVEAVEISGDVTTWTIRAPAGTSVTVRTQIIADKPNEQIAWRSVEGSDIDTEGKVMFRDAPGGRGTEVKALIAYRPPGGSAGRAVARLFQAEPAVQSRRDLKRLKMLMETGEVATSNNRNTDQGGQDARPDVSRNA